MEDLKSCKTYNEIKFDESKEKIQKCFIEELKKKKTGVESVSVSKLCKDSNINRSTFYNHYVDIYELLYEIEEELLEKIYQTCVFPDDYDLNDRLCLLVKHIKSNYDFYSIYFNKIHGTDNDRIFVSEKYFDEIEKLVHIDFELSEIDKKYHLSFFKGGMNSIIKDWVNNGCAESPEKIVQIISKVHHFFIDSDDDKTNLI